MTTEFEKQFFDTFGIEPKQFIKDFPTREKASAFGRKITGIPKYNKDKFEIGSYTNNIDIFQVHWKEYPQITDRQYLELICIISNYCQTKLQCDYQLYSVNIDELRKEVLRDCMEHSEHFKHQVQAIFKGE